MLRIDSIAQGVADTLIPPLTVTSKASASTAGWPANVISSLSMGYENGVLLLQYPQDIKETVDNLEYGDINSLPNPAISPFVRRAQSTIEQVIEDQAVVELFIDAGII